MTCGTIESGKETGLETGSGGGEPIVLLTKMGNLKPKKHTIPHLFAFFAPSIFQMSSATNQKITLDRPINCCWFSSEWAIETTFEQSNQFQHHQNHFDDLLKQVQQEQTVPVRHYNHN